MKRFIQTFFMAVIVLFFSATANAQQPNRQQRMSREQLAETEAKHIAQTLSFNDDVTAKFVTTYCNFKKEVWNLGPRQRHNQQDQSEQMNENRIKQRFAMSQKILDIRQKYYKEYSKFLTQTQIERVYEQERKIMNRHMKRVQRPLKKQ